MLVLDTNHIVELGYPSSRSERLLGRLAADPRPLAVTIISAEEQLRGWMAQMHRTSDPLRLPPLYQQFQERIEYYAECLVLPWEEEAAVRFLQFRRQRIRIGTQDLKIACIALSFEATLLTRNLSDFRQVPGLLVENWLD
ncbi:MAG TPA: type II toxin-antitoxin system VapC family toxin [Chthoniobacteraceae bacterium]|jgi:tRNA(fMet)-specific endonuclease VapC|nr:type II toxin-antitoxin system VapC family toxin [Chthoniobacteraceae bacterium]